MDGADVLIDNELTRRGVRTYLTDPGATDTDISRDATGTYLAPRFNQWGRPKVTAPRAKARDATMARRLWDLSVELTRCDWPV